MNTLNKMLKEHFQGPEWQFNLLKQMMVNTGDEVVPVLAVDGDILAFRTAAVCEHEFEGSCEAIIRATLRDIAADTGITHMRIYLSGSDNFRYGLATTKPYKGNRDGFVKPQFLGHCKKFLETEFKAIWVNGAEADDGIASDMALFGAHHCGIDKDMLQIPGKHYNYVKKEWETVTPDQGVINLYRQVLMGDASDNIPGLPRVGEKTAEKVIVNAATAADDALAYYKEICAKSLPDVEPLAYMAEQRSLVQMRTNWWETKEMEYMLEQHTVVIVPKEAGFVATEGEFEGFDEPAERPKVAGL